MAVMVVMVIVIVKVALIMNSFLPLDVINVFFLYHRMSVLSMSEVRQIQIWVKKMRLVDMRWFLGQIMIWAKKKIDSLDPIPHHSGQTQPGQHLFIDDDDYQAKLKCGLFSKRKNANKKILRARNPKLLVQKRRMLTFRDKNGIFQHFSEKMA